MERSPFNQPRGSQPATNRDLFPWPHSADDPQYRVDLESTVALIVSTPSYLIRQANPNAPSINLAEEHDLVVREFAQEIGRRMSARAITLEVGLPSAQRYIPAVRQPRTAGAITDFYDLIEFFPTLNAAVQTFGGYVEVGRLLLDLGRWWKDRVVRGGEYFAEQDRLVFTGDAIRLMCVGHAHEAYKVKPKDRPSAYVREGYFGSVDHPTGKEVYTVAVPFSRGTYLYLVDARGNVFDHYLIDRRGIHGLDLPDWFGDAEVMSKLRRPRKLGDLRPVDER